MRWPRSLCNSPQALRVRWHLHRILRRRLGRVCANIRPRFADVEGRNVLWFRWNLVERREGDGHIEVGDNCRMEGKLICHRKTSQITIGSRTAVGGGTTIESLSRVSIGDDCLISHYVTIQDHDSHPLEWDNRKNDVLDWLAGRKDWTHVKHADVVIEPRCWIGTRSVVLKGVRLGEGTVVGAGSVVTKSFPAYSLIGGNPARLIRSLPPPKLAKYRQSETR